MRKKKRLITVVMALVLTVALAVPLLSPIPVLAAAPSYQSEAHNTWSSGSSLSINKPSGTVEDDLLIAFINRDDDGNAMSAPAGWNQIHEDDYNSSRFGVWYKVAGSSEPASYSFDLGQSDEKAVGQIRRYSGVDTGDPIDVSGWGDDDSSSAIAPDVTTTVNDCTIVRLYGANGDNMDVDTYPSGTSNQWSDVSGSSGSGNGAVGACDHTQALAGLTGTATFALNDDNDWRSVTVAIAPLACTTYYKDHDDDDYGQTGDSDCLTSPSGEYTATVGGDCNDDDDTIYPGADEVCDGTDNDCDAGTADGSDESWYEDPTICGTGACASTGQWECTGGVKVDSCTPGAPAVGDATCDGVDDDCDGTVDEDYVSDESCFLPGACAAANQGSACVGGTETPCSTGTPAVTEDCDDGIDNDCDGVVDCDLKTQLAMILDGSGSISSGAWTTTVNGLAAAVGNVSCVPQDGSVELTVVQFGVPGGGGAQLEVGPVVITGSNAAAVAADIAAMSQMSGSTPMACGICLAADELFGSPNFDPALKQALNLVTDGEPNQCCCDEDPPGTYQCSHSAGTCSGTATDSAVCARDYAINLLEMTDPSDEFDVEGIGITDTNRDWLKDNIIFPATGYSSLPGSWPPPGPGWVRVVADADEFAETICEKIQIVVEPTGACCDPSTGICTDDVFEADCQYEWTEGESCADIECVAPECTTDIECDDGDVCTTDTCVDEVCVYEPYCTTDADCDDGDPGTDDVCVDGCCVYGSAVQNGVPTLTQWGMIAMGILFAAFLIWTVRRRWVVSADGRQE